MGDFCEHTETEQPLPHSVVAIVAALLVIADRIEGG